MAEKSDTVAEGAPSDPSIAPVGAPTAAESAAADKAPKKKPGRPKGSKNKASARTKAASEDSPAQRESAARKKLVKQLDGFLKGPGFLFEAVGEDWPAKHVDQAAAPFAQNLVTYAEKNPALMLRLEALFSGGQSVQLIVAGAMYLAPLLIYFGILPVPERVKLMFGVPEKPGRTIVENGAPGSWEAIPAEVREQIESEAREAGYINADGSADVDGFMRAMNEAVSNMNKGVDPDGV